MTRSSLRVPRALASLVGAVLLLAAAGCTVQVLMPEVPATHPAHPDAASAPLPEPSPLLDSYRPMESPPALEPMDHGSMDEGEMDHEEMDHEEMDHEAMGHEEMMEPEQSHPEPPPPSGAGSSEAP